MDWFGPETTVIDIVIAGGSLATVVTLLFAAIAIRQAGQARNLSSIVDIANQLNQERSRAFDAGAYDGMTSVDFHVFQMTNLVEHACFIVNKGLVSSHAKAFLLEWIAAELKQMDSQEVYRKQFDTVGPGELTELMKLKSYFDEQRRQDEYWEKILNGRHRISLQNSPKN